MTLQSSALVKRAVKLLREGGVIALPSDTLYALAAVARDAGAVRRVYAIKGREDGKPLPLFVSGIEMAAGIAELDGRARRLAQRFWPGGLTLVVRRRPDFESEALAGGETVALRVPNQPLLLEIIDALGEPLTATSANRSGGPDPVEAAEVRRQLDGEVDEIVDGGPCPVGISSTIVDCAAAELRVLRPGAVAAADIAAALDQTGPS